MTKLKSHNQEPYVHELNKGRFYLGRCHASDCGQSNIVIIQSPWVVVTIIGKGKVCPNRNWVSQMAHQYWLFSPVSVVRSDWEYFYSP